MTTYQWAEGFRPPKNVSVDEVGAAVEKHSNPESLLAASKNAKHCLHKHLWSEGDQVWANRARKEECRHIIGAVRKVYDVGGASITVRAVEFLRDNGEERWETMENIVADPNLHDAYMAEIQRLQEQAVRKMAAFRMLLKRKTT